MGALSCFIKFKNFILQEFSAILIDERAQVLARRPYLRVARVVALVRANTNGPDAARTVLRDNAASPQKSPGTNRSH